MRVVGREQAAVVMAERDHEGAGERGDVDDGRGLEALGVGQRIAQDQAAFGVGVEDLDGLARHAGDDVARLGGLAARHVVAGRDQADQVDLELQFGHRAQRAQHAGGAAHVELHLVHLGARLQRDAAGVERDALADQHHRRRPSCARALVLHDDEPRRLLGAARHRQERAHAQLLAGLAIEHFDLEAVLLPIASACSPR